MGEGVDDAFVKQDCEGAEFCRDGGAFVGADAFDEALALEAVLDDLGDAAHFDGVLGAELFEVGDAGHFAVGLHDFDDGSGGVEAGEAAEIDGAFGLACADQDAAIAAAEGIDVAGADEVGFGEIFVDGHLNALGAFFGGDSGGAAEARVQVDTDGEGGAADAGVDAALRVQVEAVAVFLGEGEAHVAHGLAQHESDSFGRDELCGQNEVALVFAVFVVGQDDHFSGTEIGDYVIDGTKWHWWIVDILASLNFGYG